MLISSFKCRTTIAAASIILLASMLASCGGGGGSETPSSARDTGAVIGTSSSTVVIAPPATTSGSSTADPVADPVFSAGSFWYRPIPADVPLHANSANFVEEFLRQKSAYYGTVTIHMDSYSSPVYLADASAPTTKVSFWDCQNKGWVDQALEAQWTAVPIPSYAQPADGTDNEMTVYQPSTGNLWEFWRARKVNGQWQGCWGGQMKNVSAGNGIWPYPYGAMSTGLPFIGGQIKAEELKSGEIGHVIGIALADLEDRSVYSWPANRSDGTNPNHAPNRIPAGARMRLDPAVDVDALPIHPVAKVIARAAQKHGFVVWDRAGSITLRSQNPKSYTALGQPDPYRELFNGTPEYAILDGFPWDRLQFLPKDYGKQ